MATAPIGLAITVFCLALVGAKAQAAEQPRNLSPAASGRHSVEAGDGVTQAINKGFLYWKSHQLSQGWVGLQDEVTSCYRRLGAKPPQRDAAYCVAIDHYTMLDTLAFPADLRPPFFQTDAVFARLDRAVASSTPPAKRASFTRDLLVAMDARAHAAHVRGK